MGLNNFSWDVEKGQHWAILGLNGSGKTTLLKVINGYIWPNDGTVQVLGETYGQTYIPKLRTRIGWVSNAMIENFNWQDNAIEIVLSGKFGALRLFEDVTDEEIEQAVGIMEQLIFPEIEYDKVDKVRGMDVIFVTTAKTDEEARELLRLFNMPFAK